MAPIAKQISLLFLLALFSSLHIQARDTQLFNKVPSTTPQKTDPNPQKQQQQQEEPNFLPENENENSYGLYGHESGQLPPSTNTLPNAKYLPKNYNPVAYVTVPENTDEDSNNNFNNFNNMKADNYFDNGAKNTYFRQQDDDANNYYYNDGSSFNSQPLTDSKFDSYMFQPQGMSDTRHLENGKYFYDINTGRYSRKHPYQSLRGVPRNYGGKNGYNAGYGQFNGGDRNSMGWYQNVQNEYQQEENYNMP